jgi:hypothetical protein
MPHEEAEERANQTFRGLCTVVEKKVNYRTITRTVWLPDPESGSCRVLQRFVAAANGASSSLKNPGTTVKRV